MWHEVCVVIAFRVDEIKLSECSSVYRLKCFTYDSALCFSIFDINDITWYSSIIDIDTNILQNCMWNKGVCRSAKMERNSIKETSLCNGNVYNKCYEGDLLSDEFQEPSPSNTLVFYVNGKVVWQ